MPSEETMEFKMLSYEELEAKNRKEIIESLKSIASYVEGMMKINSNGIRAFSSMDVDTVFRHIQQLPIIYAKKDASKKEISRLNEEKASLSAEIIALHNQIQELKSMKAGKNKRNPRRK